MISPSLKASSCIAIMTFFCSIIGCGGHEPSAPDIIGQEERTPVTMQVVTPDRQSLSCTLDLHEDVARIDCGGHALQTTLPQANLLALNNERFELHSLDATAIPVERIEGNTYILHHPTGPFRISFQDGIPANGDPRNTNPQWLVILGPFIGAALTIGMCGGMAIATCGYGYIDYWTVWSPQGGFCYVDCK